MPCKSTPPQAAQTTRDENPGQSGSCVFAPGRSAWPSARLTFWRIGRRRTCGNAMRFWIANMPMRFDVRLKLSCVSGTDDQAAQFVSRLSHSKLLRDVTLLPQGTVADAHQEPLRQVQGGLRKYRIELALDPEADIRDEPAIASAGT